MHYYKRNIGDYSKKAGRLSMLQHGAYTLLIDSCYDREQFPTLEEAIDWCWASSKVEIEAVEFVLKKFFEVVDGVYVQKRIKDELEKYHQNAETNKRIAQEREAKRKQKSTKRSQSVNEPPPNQEPRTNNHNKKYSDDSYEVALYLESKIKSFNKEAKTNPKGWAVDIDKAIRLDSRTKQGLIKMINWIYSESGKFWQPNILSGKKLREKYDQMKSQAIASMDKPQKNIISEDAGYLQ